MKPNFLKRLIFTLFVLFSAAAFSQSAAPEKVVKPVLFDVLPSLKDVPQVTPAYVDQAWKEKVIPNKDGFLEEFKVESSWTGPDPVLQDNTATNRSTATIADNFAGNYNQSGVAPPDTQGDVGLSHYMQMVNLSFQIWDKNGTSLYGPVASSTLWSGFTGPWSTSNDGDPIVLYDQYADRWIASQFALPNYPNGPFYELIAVSQTSDPTGAWNRYAYEFANMPDYPKFGIWPDGYYFTINQFAPPSLSFAGAGVCVLDRAAMLTGDPGAQMIFFNLGTSFGSLLPADADGSALPPAGSPAYLANLGTTSLRIWSVDIDWVNIGNSTLSLVHTLPVQSYSYSGIVINQVGTSQTLDALASRLMYRLQYRNFGSYQVMLTNHSVNANDAGQAGVRWYEMRNYGSGWSIYQQGTYAPADGVDRWMGSVAMNGNGDIAVGYSACSSTTYPSVRIAGQTASNSGTGILDVNETVIHPGQASQTGINRWGDYSMMSVDPTDDATFWFTSEYSSGGWNWKTQIASFNFAPPVVIAPVADFSGNPTSIMATQAVSFTDLSTNNPTSWSWSFPNGIPSTSTERNPQVTYDTPGIYSVTLTATNSAGSDEETKIDYITVTPYVVSYCNSAGSNTTKEWIASFSLGEFSNFSGNNSGYRDFTSPPIQVTGGNSYNISLSPGYASRPRGEYWRVWIDFNSDGDFDDAGEEVYTANNLKNTVSGSVTMPSGLSGETRMRVSMKYGAAPAPCEVFTFGEVEDYNLSFSTPVPQPPVAEFSGAPTNITVGENVQFTDLSINNPTSWTWAFEGGTPSSSTTQNPLITYNTTGTYFVTLTVTNGQGSDTETKTGYITVNAANTSYCASFSNSNAVEYITGVTVSNLSNPSGASPYTNYTSDPDKIVQLTGGSTYNVTLNPNTTSQRNFWRIWIDFNGDFDFDDAGETLYSANNKKGTATGSITIPSGVSGTTRMRVTLKTGGAPTPCENFGDGEVEDYMISFGNGPVYQSAEHKLSLDVFPNPATNVLNILVSSSDETVVIRLYSALGQVIDEFELRGGKASLNLEGYPKGIYYLGAEDKTQTALKKFIRE